MLDGNVQILDDLGLLCHHTDEFIIDFIGIDIVDTNPMNPIDSGQLPEQLRQQPPVAGKIGSVAAGILSHHNQFLHTGIGQHSGFVEYIIHLSAAVLAPQRGNDTVGAVVVTSLGDFDVSIVGGGGENPGGFHLRCVDGIELRDCSSLQQRLNGRYNLGIAPRTQHTVHLGHFLTDLPLIPLGEASGDQNLPDFSLCF